MSGKEIHQYGPDTFELPERGEIYIEGCPENITERLQRAAFTRDSPGVFTKRQQALESNHEYEIVTVTVDENRDTLHISATDIVGVVSLTPTAKLQINPKIPWESIFDMLLAVYEKSRSVTYHGVPLEDFLSDDVALEDVFVVLAINYIEGMRVIQRHGFIRDLLIERVDSFDGRGDVDVEQTLLNHARGVLAPQWIRNRTEYDNAANSLLHYAGATLLRLFRQNASENEHPAYDRLFSHVHREVERLEEMGVTSGFNRMDAYRQLTLADLPTQRRYYRKAFDVSKAIMTSSLGQQLRDGRQELIVDYVLNMESLFEQYSQVVIERQLDYIKTYDHLLLLEDVTATRSPSVQPFETEGDVYHQPDHALERGEETIAVLDSKYYAEGHDPVRESASRSRLFSYAYLLDADHLAFLCPLLDSKHREITQTGAQLQVVSPTGEFTLDGYDTVVREYLHDVLATEYPQLNVFRSVRENKLCLDGASEKDLRRATDMAGPFTFKDPRQFSLRVLKAAADEHSFNALNRYDLEQEGEWTRNQIEIRCEQWYEHTTTCVPVFCRQRGEEWIDLYFLDNGAGKVEKEGSLELL